MSRVRGPPRLRAINTKIMEKHEPHMQGKPNL